MTRRDDRLGRTRWLLGCFSCDQRMSSGEYLRAAAEAIGCRPYQLLDGPVDALGAPRSSTDGEGEAAVVPSQATLAGWRSRLASDPRALDYLRGRGLSLGTIHAARLGYGSIGGRPPGIVIPVPPKGRALNVKQRFWPEPWLPSAGARECKSAGLRGRGAQLYPSPPERGSRFVLCEGEFDALLLRQHGIVALTSTAGTSWLPDWNDFVDGCVVAVIYDAGSHELAERRASELVASGAAQAWPVDLAAHGLPHGHDITDWFTTHGKTRRELVRLIKTSRIAWREQGALR